jgi:hypothetical protein
MSHGDIAREDYRWVTLLATGSNAERAIIFAEQNESSKDSRLYFDRGAIEQQTRKTSGPRNWGRSATSN